MSTEMDEFLAEHGLGRLERRLRLGGRLALAGAPELPAELSLTERGSFIVAKDGPFAGGAVAADDPTRVRYQLGRLSDRITVDEQVLSVPTGRGAEARELIALGRLRRRRAESGRAAAPLSADRYIEETAEFARELVAALLTPDDDLLALLEFERDQALSALGAHVERRHYLVLSAEAALLASFSELGDVETEASNPGTLRVENQPDGFSITDGSVTRRAQAKHKGLLLELCELARLPASERVVEAARRLQLTSRSPRARSLLAAAARRGDALASVLEVALDIQLGRDPAPTSELTRRVAAFDASEQPRDALADAFRRWHFTPATGREFLNRLAPLRVESRAWSLSLHRALRSMASADKDLSDDELARWDVELAEHELAAGETSRARSLAESRLRLMGLDEGAVELSVRDGQASIARARLHELLCQEARLRGVDDVPALGALARLDPSSEARLRALANAKGSDPAETRLVARAARVLSCTTPGGIEQESRPAPNDSPLPFERLVLDQRLRHPLARSGGRLATRLSELVAAVPEPDLGFLRDFCEELSVSRHTEAARALARATRLLSLPRVAAYVSHGARSVGLRAFGSGEPFILIGERHLVGDGACVLKGSELDFALGAELSHLAFGHERVTAGEVWAGAAGKTKNALAALGFVLPVVVDLGGPRVQRVLGKLSVEAFERATRGALRLPELFAPRAAGSGEPLGQRNEELILAHRLVQLSADRAGLAIARDLGGALRAMLLTRSDYGDLLDAARAHGLLRALDARRVQNPGIADLWLRVRAIIAFYLSPEFDSLSADDD